MTDALAPPLYDAVTGSSDPGTTGCLQHLTIIPEYIGHHKTSSRLDTEPFTALIAKANKFLRENPRYAVNTCESVEFLEYTSADEDESAGVADAEASAFVYYGESANRCIRALRLWLELKSQHQSSESSYDQIGYYNFLPDVRRIADEDGSIDVELDVERLDSLVARINNHFKKQPVPGRIVTIETQPIKWGSRGTEPDATMWTERGGASSTFINLLRVFYVTGIPRNEQIGLADFVPAKVSDPDGDDEDEEQGVAMETFPVVLTKARKWLLSVPPNYRPVNVQSVVFRWSFNKGIDTNSMTYHEGKKNLNYLRYIRVAYVIQDVQQTASRLTINLNSTLFIPNSDHQTGAFESQRSVLRRMNQWAARTGAAVVSVESVSMRIGGGGEVFVGFDAMYTWNDTHLERRGLFELTPLFGTDYHTVKSDETFCRLFRVYTDGLFPDAEEERTREAMRNFQETGCCEGLAQLCCRLCCTLL